MTVETVNFYAQFTGDGSTTSFPFSFPVQEASDLDITYTDATGDVSTYASGAFAVTLNVGSVGGNVVFLPAGLPPAAGSIVLLNRYVVPLQGTAISSQDGWAPELVTDALDKLTMVDQQLTDAINRSIRAPLGDPANMQLPPAFLRANKSVYFDNVGGLALTVPGNASGTLVTATNGLTASSLAVRASHFLNLKDDFGAAGDGVTDDTTAFTAAMVALSIIGGGMLFCPPGAYILQPDQTIPSFVAVRGAGAGSTRLVFNGSLNSDGFTLNTQGELTDVTITATTPRTGGTLVRLAGNVAKLAHFVITNYYQAIAILGASISLPVVKAKIEDGDIFNPSPSAVCAILCQFFSSCEVNDVLIAGPLSGAQPAISVQVRHGDTLFLGQINATRHGEFLANPQNGEFLGSLTMQSCIWDSNNGGGAALFQPAAGGQIIDTTVIGTWCGLSSGGGMTIDGSVGMINGFRMVGGVVPGNLGGDGIKVIGPNALYINISGTQISASSGNGIYLTGSCQHITATGFQCGSVGGRGPNQEYGVKIDAGCNHYQIIGEAFENQAGQVLEPTPGANRSVITI